MSHARTSPQTRHWWRSPGQEAANACAAPRQGDLCPHCGRGRLAVDGRNLFRLTCPHCGFVGQGGAFT